MQRQLDVQPEGCTDKKPLNQLAFLAYEMQLIISGRPWRWFHIWFSPAFGVIFSYRMGRFFYLLLGRYWHVLHVMLMPLIFFTRPWRAQCRINCKADIGKGLRILHPTLGILVSEYVIAGEHLTLTGGNCIGTRIGGEQGPIVIGDYVSLGVNATVLGPVTLGNHINIGANALVIHNADNHVTLVGVPAKAKAQTISSPPAYHTGGHQYATDAPHAM